MIDKFTYKDIVQSLISHCEIEFEYQGNEYGFVPTNQQTQWSAYRFYDEASEQTYDTYQQALQEYTIDGKSLEEIFRGELYTFISGLIYWES
jgi:hypothetical protein